MKRITPRWVRIRCENCGPQVVIQRYEPMGCPECKFPIKQLEALREEEFKAPSAGKKEKSA